MFSENLPEKNKRIGFIEVITGSMFSGKTEELIRRLKRAMLANQKVKIFKPKIDQRYSATEIISHNDNSISSIPVDAAKDIFQYSEGTDVVAIDEAQFFDDGIVEVCNDLANKGIRVIVAGLDMDFKGNGFGAIPQLMSIAEYVTKLQAICQQCGGLAYISYRKSDQQNLIVLGEKKEYKPLCRSCYNKIKH